MERATKLVVVLWAILALAAELWLVRGAWSGAVPLTILAFVVSAGATALDRRMVSAVLAFTYVFPALIDTLHGQYYPIYGVVWTGALLGAIAPEGLRTPWHVPARWRPALACAALTIVSGALVVIFREVDFYPGLLFHEHAAGPAFMLQWVIHVAQLALVGILWFDWLFGAELDFRAAVVTPLACSALVMASVTLYQLFVDVTFLNTTFFGEIARASGTLMDANVCGAVAATWVGGALLWGWESKGWRRWLMAGGTTAAWLTVWGTGSRTAFAGAVIVSLFSCPALLFGYPPATWRKAAPSIGALALVVLLLAFLLANASQTTVGPLRRFSSTLPARSGASIRAFVLENVWVRNGYGVASTEMIRHFPWFGVGVGSFQAVLPEFARLPPDNAQNWYRHQVAELGIVGSLGWAWWLVLFAAFVLKRRPQAPRAVWIARGMLVAFAATSFVGMPAQDMSVSITFWTTAFWFVSLVGPPAPAPVGRLAWSLVATVITAFTAGTLHAGSSLRPPVRAERMGTPYQYGFYPIEPDGTGGVQRWARKRAVEVLDVSGEWMELTVSVNHLDVERRPVDVMVWVDGLVVLNTRLATVQPVKKYVALPRDRPRVLVQTWVSRVLKPPDSVPDGRELGLLVSWKFVDGPLPPSVRGAPR